MFKFRSLSLICFSLLLSSVSNAADIPGSKDPIGIKRYEGSQIVRFENISFDAYVVPLGMMTKFDFGTKVAEFKQSETIEGKITRVSYRIPDPNRSSLEVFRNYESSFKEAGWEIAWSASGKAQFGNSFSHIYQSLKDNDQLFTYSDSQAHFLVARKAEAGLTATLFVTKYEYGLTRGIKLEKNEPIVQLDVIESKPMEEKMVVISSSEMAKTIDQGGRVSLYGIYFDFNKADIKPESEATLLQIANLLRERGDLKLLLVGHTDNVGDFDLNLQLSDRRAKAVIAELNERYGVDTTRLRGFGASFSSPIASNSTEEGRAKNRRVELVDSTQSLN